MISKLNRNLLPEYHPEFWTYHASCKNKTNDAPPVVGYTGKMAFLSIYFSITNPGGTTLIGYIDKNILPTNLTMAHAACTDGRCYPIILHHGLQQLYADVVLPVGTYAVQFTWPIK